MIATEKNKSNFKNRTSRAAYFRNYRKRAKTSFKRGAAPFALSWQLRFNLTHLLIVLTVFTTGYLIYTSTQILTGSFFERILVACLSELLIVALVVFEPKGSLERLGRLVLLSGFMIYAVSPFVAEPFKKVEALSQQQSLIQERVASLKLQVAQQSKLYEELVVRSRISAAQSVALELQNSQTLLRNTLLESAASAELAVEQTRTAPPLVALQRLLFILANMLFLHRVAHSKSTTRKEPQLTNQSLPNAA